MPAKIPNLSWGKVSNNTETQIGCVYCLGANLEAPVAHGVFYLWQGTSMCAEHLHSMFQTPEGGSSA